MRASALASATAVMSGAVLLAAVTAPASAFDASSQPSGARPWWEAAGCSATPAILDDNGDVQPRLVSCPKAAAAMKGACDALSTGQSALEAISSNAHVLECIGPDGGRSSSAPGMRWTGCLFGHWTSYLEFAQGGFRLLKSRDEFTAAFTPLRTPSQALAFAAALTGDVSLTRLNPPKNFTLVHPDEKASYAKTAPDGFEVRLFAPHPCVLNPSWEAIDYSVSAGGDIHILSRTEVFIPKTGRPNQCCVD